MVSGCQDHGFQLGQHRLPGDKRHPYEHDIRIPFGASLESADRPMLLLLVVLLLLLRLLLRRGFLRSLARLCAVLRGPGVAKNHTSSAIVMSIDVAPTFVAIATGGKSRDYC